MNAPDNARKFLTPLIGLGTPIISFESAAFAAEQMEGSTPSGFELPGGNPAILLLPTAAYLFYVGVQTAFPKFSRKGSANYITILYAMGLLYFGSLLLKQ